MNRQVKTFGPYAVKMLVDAGSLFR